MAKCPKCGAEVVNPVKSWSMIGKPNRSGEMFKLTIGLYNCVCSDKSFRSVIGKEKITLNGVLEKNNSLEEQLMEATSRKTELECAVKALEEEKNQLLAEVEALRAIPILEERVSSLEDDVAKLREEKGALMSRLTTLADTTPITSPPLVEKPLDDYISETVNDEMASTIEEHIQESPSLEINVTQTEEPTINVVPTMTPEQENLPVETIAAEPPVELPAVEAIPVTDIPEDPAIKIPCEQDTPSTDKVVETPVETIAANIPLTETSPPVEKPIIDEVIATPPMEATSAEVKQVETPAIEQKVATEVADTTSMDNTKEEVPISEPQVITPAIEEQPREAPQEPETVLVEANQDVPATLQINTEPIESAPVQPEETQITREEPLVEVKPLEDIPVEANPIQNPTLETAEISPPVALVDTPSIEERQSEDTLIESVKNDIASAEKLCQEISEIAKKIDEVKPSEDLTATLTPPNLTEPAQVIPMETTQPEIQKSEEEKTIGTPVIQPPTLDIPKIEEATTNIATPSIEEKITATPLVNNEKLSEEKPSEVTTKLTEEKQPGFVV